MSADLHTQIKEFATEYGNSLEAINVSTIAETLIASSEFSYSVAKSLIWVWRSALILDPQRPSQSLQCSLLVPLHRSN